MTDIPKEFVASDGLGAPAGQVDGNMHRDEDGDDDASEDEEDDEDAVNSEYVLRLRSRHPLSGCVTSIHAVPAMAVEHRNSTDSECLLLSFDDGKV